METIEKNKIAMCVLPHIKKFAQLFPEKFETGVVDGIVKIATGIIPKKTSSGFSFQLKRT